MIRADGAGAAPVLFIGDSITEQWSRHRPYFFADHGFLNRGVGGQTTRDLRARFTDELDRAQPRAVHIMGGLNDIAGNGGTIPLSETEETVMGLAREARERGCAVFVASVTPAEVIAWNPDVRPAELILALNARLRERAAAEDVEYVDFHSVLRTPSGGMRAGIGSDGSHLDPAGYRMIEPVLLQTLARRLGPIEPRRLPRGERVRRWLRQAARR